MQRNYVKSPLNYTGNKFRIIDQIHQYFPTDINVMVDLFCGGCDVTINTDAKKHYANDINYLVVDIFREFQKYSIDDALAYIDKVIADWGLTDTDGDAYNKFREYYNQTKNPIDLFILLCYSFNHQVRFNSTHEFNMPFGYHKGSFNSNIRYNLVTTLGRLKDVEFSTKPFQEFDFDILSSGDFLYADPPYLIACGTYNDGKRGFTGWGEKEETDLYLLLSDIDKKGIKFALSNVSEHKGQTNDILLKWVSDNGYYLHIIDFNYDNCSYHGKNTDKPTKEVLITNYQTTVPTTFTLF